LEELNIKTITWKKSGKLKVNLDLNLNSELLEEGRVRELIRRVQQERKVLGARLDQHIRLTAPLPQSPSLQALVQKQTLSQSVSHGEEIKIELI